VNLENLEKLPVAGRTPCVSIFMPLASAGSDVGQINRLRCRNLLDDAESQLVDVMGKRREAEALLGPGRELVEGDDPKRWRGRSLGLFTDGDTVDVRELSVVVESGVYVGDRYHLKPLIGALGSNVSYFVLDLNRHHVRLFRGSRDALSEVDLGDVPRDFRDVVGHRTEERHVQYHTGTGSSAAPGQRPARFHAHGQGDDDVEDELRRFVEVLEPAVHERVKGSGLPLILAGLEPMPSLYRERNGYDSLSEREIRKNVGEDRPDEILEISWPLASDIAEERTRADKERIEAGLGNGRATNVLADVVAASDDGAVETLFVAQGETCWGSFSRDERKVTLRKGPGEGAEDLLDRAAFETFARGGQVHVVGPDQMPGDDEVPLAAELRFPGLSARLEK
jgi:hypothetical protein